MTPYEEAEDDARAVLRRVVEVRRGLPDPRELSAAARAAMNRSYWSAVETGRREHPSLLTLCRMARAVGCRVVVVGGDGGET